MKLRLFWIFWSIDVLIALIVVGFFLVGLYDGSVSDFNIGIWFTMLAVLAVIITGGLWLKNRGHLVIGMVLVLVLAIPGLLSGLILLLTVLSGSSWN
jgi:hypothetical protein